MNRIVHHGDQTLAGILGSLFERILDRSGAWPEGWSEEKWVDFFKCARFGAAELRDMLRDVAMDYGIDWQDMQLDPVQAESLGLIPRVADTRKGSGDE